jgi:hypothetical protein
VWTAPVLQGDWADVGLQVCGHVSGLLSGGWATLAMMDFARRDPNHPDGLVDDSSGLFPAIANLNLHQSP